MKSFLEPFIRKKMDTLKIRLMKYFVWNMLLNDAET